MLKSKCQLAKEDSMKFYVIKDKYRDKWSDGSYGWDGDIHNDYQVFSEDRLPYVPNEEMDFICVAEGDYKPSLEHVRLQLGLQEIH
jgi:hypothetical protein